jgi:membrane protein DedA with SNARE-associated domain
MITLTTHPTFLSTLQWLLQNSYPVMFLGMIIEGPTIIAAASFAVTMGYFNLVTIFILAVLGDVIGDFIFYSIGYFGRVAVINKLDRKFKASKSRIEKLKKLVHQHPGKIVTVVKLAPLLPMPGLVAIGSTHLPPKKFAKIILAIIIPKTLLFMAIGYFFGHAYNQIYKIINDGVLGIIIVVVFLFLMQYGYKKISERISQRLERD